MKIVITDKGGQILYEGSPNLHGNGIIVGSANDCEIQLNKMGLARHHLQIRYNADGYLTLQDLQSPWGTVIDGIKVQSGFITTVKPGVFIELTVDVFMRLQEEIGDKIVPLNKEQIFPFLLNGNESFVRKTFTQIRSKIPRQYYSSISAAEGEMVTRIKELSAIVEVSYALNSIKSFPRLLDFILEMSLTVTGGERAMIMLFNEELRRLETVAIHNFQPSELTEDIQASASLVSKCFESGDTMIGPSPKFRELYLGNKNPESVGIVSIATVALKEGATNIGVLYVDTKHSGNIMAKRTDQLLKIFASQAAVAIKQTRMFHDATTDPTTGVSNQNLFLRRLGEEFCRAQRHQIDISLILIDIDNFSGINRTHGENNGDRVLKEVGKILNSATRAHDLVSRTGPDSFAMLLPETGKAGAQVVAKKLRDTLNSTRLRTSGHTIQITGSFGIANSSKLTIKPADLLKNAEKMLKQAQKRGGNQIA